MNDMAAITFELDGRQVTAMPGETIWQVAKRLGTEIPHLCYADAPGYRADGNCRACMVEIDGERTLAASCIRRPTSGMVVHSQSARARTAQNLVLELLLADQPSRDAHPEPDSHLWRTADALGVTGSRFAPHAQARRHDMSHAAMAVNLDACIQCNLCVRACREVQMNDVIGMAARGAFSEIVFDQRDPMGDSTCVACGECVQACPTGALIEKSLVTAAGVAAEQRAASRTVDSLCPFCGVGCQTSVHVNDNRIVAVDGRNGPANEQRLCVKGRFGYDYITHEGRLVAPLQRRNDVPKQWDMDLRDSDWREVFEPVSWDAALDRAAAGLQQAYRAGGPGALAGFGSAKGSNEEAYLFQKLMRTAFHTNNVDHCTRLCHASSVAALMEGIGSGAVSAPFTAAEDAECIIVIGARPTVNHPVAATYLKQAARRGAKLIVMDPRRQGLSRHAWRHLAFKPGMDVPLLGAMLHTIIKEDLVNHAYVARMVEGVDAFTANIERFAPEAMAPVCGIDAETIREVARTYATAQASLIFWGMGISQHVHGTDNARCLIALALLTGQIGRPGTGLHPLRGQNNVQGASDAGLIPIVYPDYRPVDDPAVHAEMERFWGTTLDARRGLTVVEIMDAIRAEQIRAMYIMGENPAMSDPDQIHTRQALASLDHLVVQDLFLTETAWQADVILPASAHAEKTGTFTNTNRQVQLGRAALELPGAARQDWWITQALANRLGLGWTYAHPRDVFAEMKQVMRSLDNITWERLEQEGAVTYPCRSPEGQGDAIVFAERFPTRSGKGRLVPVDIVPPAELPDAEYPMVLTTGRLLEHWHTGAMTRRASALDAIEPAASAGLHPRELERLALAPGDPVRVTTRRGSIELAARADPEVPAGMVFVPFCFNEAAANVLTNPALDPFGKIPEFKFAAARVEALQAIAAE